MTRLLPKVHRQRLSQMLQERIAEEADMQRRFGNPMPRSVRVVRLKEIRALQEVFWLLNKLESS